MKALNLNRLNLHAPYSVWLVSKDNYGFRSSHDVVFRICFVDDSTIWHEGAVEFSILGKPFSVLSRSSSCVIQESYYTSVKPATTDNLYVIACSFVGSTSISIIKGILLRFHPS